MISKAINLILSQINQFIPPGAGGDEVITGNIAFNESPDQNQLQNHVVASLVNVEEESTMKNGAFLRKGINTVTYTEPAVNLNLYLLFSALYDNYVTALDRLSDVIRFFQHRKSFSVDSAGVLPAGIDPTDPQDASIYLTPEFYTLTFEQINHLWGALGGKQMPFVMYKIRLITIDQESTTGDGPLIQEVVNNTQTNAEDC